MPHLRVHSLPGLVRGDSLADCVAVVVDVLRATTTIASALSAGARAVVPCATIDDARRLVSTFPRGTSLLGGERGGLPIEGFDLGNSPAEYASQIVTGKTILLTTTNGTKALLHCRRASEIVLAAFVNLSAVCDYLTRAQPTGVDIVCAGTDSHATSEDVLLAGAVAARFADLADWQLDDSAEIARYAWTALCGGDPGPGLASRLLSALRDSRGGRNLISIGMSVDIDFAAAVDRFSLVPRFNPVTGAVVTADVPSKPSRPE
jgi:2-phosphosulfolactate phosphatase